EAMWRLCESLASRPQLIAQMIVLGEARMVVGLLRKIDAPAFAWNERLRSLPLYGAFLAAFQNDPWSLVSEPDLEKEIEDITRIYRRFAEGLSQEGSWEWTRETLQHSWDVAASGEDAVPTVLAGMAADTVFDMILRWQRFRLDAELTALVLEARAEKTASRDGEWPKGLANLESSIC